jgi:FKBP-type peptidyl-prolyl cis-trans isomerase SlyD
MLIEKNTVVTLRYTVKDAEDVTVDAGEQPLQYLHGDYDGIFPMIEEALQGKAVGEQFEVNLQPEDAFGLYQVELMKIEQRSLFPADLEVGTLFEGKPEGGTDDDIVIYRVTDIGEETVIVDGTHPLAGVPLVFAGEIIDVRAATAQEIEHQHVHNGECR